MAADLNDQISGSERHRPVRAPGVANGGHRPLIGVEIWTQYLPKIRHPRSFPRNREHGAGCRHVFADRRAVGCLKLMDLKAIVARDVHQRALHLGAIVVDRADVASERRRCPEWTSSY